MKTRQPNESKLSVDSTSGAVCIAKALDYEVEKTVQAVIEAIDHLGASATTVVNIDVDDVNDNVPVFYPQFYNITIREGDDHRDGGWRELLIVQASDLDSGLGGEVRYSLSSGEPSLFRVHPTTGAISAREALSRGDHTLQIEAIDGLGRSSHSSAFVQISVIAQMALAPIFSQAKYEFHTSEDILPGISIGGVEASGGPGIRYSIYSGDPGNHFTIHPETGRLTVARYLDADKQDTLLLNVKADLPGGLSNHTQVLIQIDDHNDNPPEFPQSLIEVVVKEDTRPQQTIFIVQAIDKDKRKNGELTYSLISSVPPAPILVQPITGHLVLTAPLDFERIKEYRLRVKAQDHGIPPRSSNVTVYLKVSDVNDNKPIFEKDLYKGKVFEHSAVKTQIIQVKANDLDSEENGRIEYRMDESVIEFGVDIRNGIIFTKKDLDREVVGEYNVTVYAFDSGNPSRVGSTKVFIEILDINDHSPECIDQTITITSDTDSRKPLGALLAIDLDSGENGALIYRSQSNHPNFIVKGNGEIFLRNPLGNSVEHRVSVIVSDTGKPARSTVCHFVIRVVEGKSKIELKRPFESTIRIGNNCTNGCRLAQINATNVAFWQIQSNEHSTLFSITSTGILSLSNSVEATKNPIAITLILSDDDGRQILIPLRIIPYRDFNGEHISISIPLKTPIGTKLIEIGEKSKLERDGERDRSFFYNLLNKTDLIDVDEVTGDVFLIAKPKTYAGQVIDFFFEKGSESTCETAVKIVSVEIEPSPIKPRFTRNLFHTNLSEATIPDSIIFTPMLDVWPKTTSFKLLEGDDYFSIDPTRGVLSLSRPIDWSETPSLIAVISAENDGLSASAAILFNIEDTNNHSPRIISRSTVLLSHPAARPLHFVVGVDEDSGDNSRLIYSIVNGDKANFAIDPITGAISLNRHINADQQLTIRVTDNGNPPRFSEQKIEIKLHHSTKRWSFFKRPHFFVELETLIPGTPVIEFSSTGKEKFTLLPFKIPFSIVEKSGRITVSQKLEDYEYNLLVFAENDAGESDHTTVRVIRKRNENIGVKISSASCGSTIVRENTPVSHLKRIVATSPTGNVTYQIQAGNDGMFILEEKTGWLSCNKLDREIKEEYILVITANEANKSDTCTVRIRVDDENDNAPTWIESFRDRENEMRIDDETQLRQEILTLIAMDVDGGENGKLEYTISEDPTQLLDIDPNSGKIFFARALPVLTQESKIRVRVTDRGVEKRLFTEKTIILRDYRTHYEDPPEKPQFLREHYVGSVDEGQPRGREILTVSTLHSLPLSSRDSRITYSIIDGNHDSAFEIDGFGTIRTALELDREIRSFYDLSILAVGQFSAQVRTRVSITVLNTNDNAPSFAAIRKRRLSEGTMVGTLITTVIANDVDEGTILEYSIQSEFNDEQETSENHFSIDSRTGAIHLVKRLDREKFAEISLKIRAWDGKYTAYTSLLIEVIDENDNAPIFTQQLYEAPIPSSLKIGEVVTVLSAIDYDVSTEFSKIIYSMHDPAGIFVIDSKTGIITLGKVLSENLKSSFLISVTASDQGIPPKSSHSALQITLNDKTKIRQPQFEIDFYNFTAPENTPLHLAIGRFGVSRVETDLTSFPLYFRVLDPSAQQFFDIDRFGNLWLRRALTDFKKSLFEFPVDVSTGWRGSLSQNSTAHVTIQIIDENDHSPIFQSSDHLKILFHEDFLDGHLLTKFSVIDEDLGENGRIGLRIVAGDHMESVQLDESGALFWKGADKSPPNGSLVIVATDFGVPSRSTLMEVPFSVEISKWRLSAPFFAMPQYRRHVREGHSSLGLLGSQIIAQMKAVNRLGLNISLQYSLKDQDPIFSIDPLTGEITSLEALDFEKQQRHTMTVSVTDSGRSAVTPLEIIVLPIDEFPPIFLKSSYTFTLSIDADPGTEIGQVLAIDGDAGNDGIVHYRIEERKESKSGRNFGIDPSSGLIRLRTKLDTIKNGTIETLLVIAESGPLQRSRTTVFVEIGGLVGQKKHGSLLMWSIWAAIGVLMIFLLILLILCVYRHKRKQIESPRKQVYAVSRGQIAVMANVSRDSPVKSRLPNPLPSSMSSSNSETQNIRSSGISSREFFTTRSQPDSGIDHDTVSLTSSVNEYLQSLGVSIPTKNKTNQRPSLGYSRDGDSLIYARLEDIVRSDPSPVTRTEHLRTFPCPRSASPSFQPLTEIFAEIERLQREPPPSKPSTNLARFVNI
ncbi:unnamed protein product, partial [Mesorhabditis belari]|uniref:Cadherin domain-containing protein n=1 Tax=Mesorhabditis belari TaxID=2138241 RepID=A0AAF3E9W4_9BILA